MSSVHAIFITGQTKHQERKDAEILSEADNRVSSCKGKFHTAAHDAELAITSNTSPECTEKTTAPVEAASPSDMHSLLQENLAHITHVIGKYCTQRIGDRDHRKTFIVHMNKLAMPTPFTDHVQWYSSLIQSVAVSLQDHDSKQEEERVVYTYRSAFHGIAARLTEEEAERLSTNNGVVSILPDTKYELQTTRSAAFLGLESHDKKMSKFDKLIEQNVVVGVVDTGIWPESESFNDTGFGPPPAHWKGSCEVGRGFEKRHCTNKIVGARSFYRGYEAANGGINDDIEYKSPRDQDGHGTHTAATVAGSPVNGASLFGYGYGTARGMSPGARIAAYKVCWTGGCFSSDILSAVDQAVADGVNVLSISLGGGASSYYRDSLSIAAFGAMELGILVSCAAGNEGPQPSSITNVSPWMFTVGASTIDRDFPATVKLGTGDIVVGVSVYKGRRNLSPEKMYPLVYMGSNNNLTSPDPSALCMEGMLDKHLVAGKIVICDRGVNPRIQKGQVVKDAGGVGMILSNTVGSGGDLAADSHLLPVVAVGENEGNIIKQYVMKDKNWRANLAFFATKIGVRPSPVVAGFSSRGPNVIT
ncbi:hypothetical protein M8C21_018233 [Ambrosia artemisiifolia]|uniref:Uncharacterized protein n=1 Tax=Ambrosia artemisiifolia TaxID=4212 RepID=A0AAD5GVJ7_AMBAR|nr:hypothetical protein M8C21_018233 [Ambrosia artemisiifolia]